MKTKTNCCRSKMKSASHTYATTTRPTVGPTSSVAAAETTKAATATSDGARLKLNAAASYHFSQNDATLHLHLIHVRSSSHSAPTGLSNVLISRPTPHHIRPHLQRCPSLFCSPRVSRLRPWFILHNHGITTILRRHDDGLYSPKTLSYS